MNDPWVFTVAHSSLYTQPMVYLHNTVQIQTIYKIIYVYIYRLTKYTKHMYYGVMRIPYCIITNDTHFNKVFLCFWYSVRFSICFSILFQFFVVFVLDLKFTFFLNKVFEKIEFTMFSTLKLQLIFFFRTVLQKPTFQKWF